MISFAAKLQEYKEAEKRVGQLIGKVDEEAKEALRELGRAALHRGVPCGFTVSLPAVLDGKDVFLKLERQDGYVEVDVSTSFRGLAWGKSEAQEVRG